MDGYGRVLQAHCDQPRFIEPSRDRVLFMSALLFSTMTEWVTPAGGGAPRISVDYSKVSSWTRALGEATRGAQKPKPFVVRAPCPQRRIFPLWPTLTTPSPLSPLFLFQGEYSRSLPQFPVSQSWCHSGPGVTVVSLWCQICDTESDMVGRFGVTLGTLGSHRCHWGRRGAQALQP
jgi:hypothetical protein